MCINILSLPPSLCCLTLNTLYLFSHTKPFVKLLKKKMKANHERTYPYGLFISPSH